jgi:hypothetical protein
VFALKGFDTLASMLRLVFGGTCPQNTPCFNWNDLLTAGGLLKSFAQGVVAVAADFIGSETNSAFLKTLVTNLGNGVATLLEQWDTLKDTLKAQSGTTRVLAIVKTTVTTFIKDAIRQALGETHAALGIVNLLADQVGVVLEDPAGFATKARAIVQAVGSTADSAKNFARSVISAFLTKAAEGLGASPVIRGIITKAAALLTDSTKSAAFWSAK